MTKPPIYQNYQRPDINYLAVMPEWFKRMVKDDTKKGAYVAELKDGFRDEMYARLIMLGIDVNVVTHCHMNDTAWSDFIASGGVLVASLPPVGTDGSTRDHRFQRGWVDCEDLYQILLEKGWIKP